MTCLFVACVVSVDLHYKNQSNYVGLLESGYHHFIECKLFSENICSFDVKTTIAHSIFGQQKLKELNVYGYNLSMI